MTSTEPILLGETAMSDPIKLLIMIGTRPECIKLAPVVAAALQSSDVAVRLCLTGQHRQMVDEVLGFFDLQPDYQLDVMRENQDLNGVTSRILTGLRPILLAERPDAVLVQGDTITCFAASLAAFYERIPVCHVEAGLRTYDLSAPFPEEAMRQLVTRIASLHFAATNANRENLLREGVSDKAILVTGNTVIDALLFAQRQVSQDGADPLKSVDSASRSAIESANRLILITGHRRETFGEGLANICRALSSAADLHPDVLFVYPVHPNPVVLSQVRSILSGKQNVLLLPPLDYPAFIYLMKICHFVVTDSGGIQEEAPALGKPVIVTREKTERREAVESGQVFLAGTSEQAIVAAIDGLLTDSLCYSQMSSGKSPYGDGRAATRIIDSTVEFVRRLASTSANVSGLNAGGSN
jgi:UDP-N-acetylglucosamine 2-epimerase (non-hydrolysing)